MERKSFPFELEEKGLDPEERTFQGFAAVMGNIDDGYPPDVIERGAFKKTIKEMGERVKVYFIHDFMQPIGKVLELKEVSRGKLPAAVLERAPEATGGLFVKGYVSDTTLGNDALTLMKDTVLDELSIGYDVVNQEWDEEEEIRHLQEIILMDVSPVPLAMNPAAIVTSVKSWLESIEGPQGKDDVEPEETRALVLLEQARDAMQEVLAFDRPWAIRDIGPFVEIIREIDQAGKAIGGYLVPRGEGAEALIEALIQGGELQKQQIQLLLGD